MTTDHRTEADLAAAFALLEQLADRTDAERTTREHPADPTSLSSGRPAPTARPVSRGRQRLLTVAAAAAVVALAGGVAALTHSTDHPAAPAGRSTGPAVTDTGSPAPSGTPTTPGGPADRHRLPFAVHLPPGDAVGAVLLQTDGSASVVITTPHGDVELTVDPALGVDRRVATTQAEPVDIDGRAGWYGADIGLTYTVPDPTNSPGGEPPSSAAGPAGGSSGPSSAPIDPGQRAVAWQYDGHAWAVLKIETPFLDRGALLALARSIDFAGSTAVRTPILLHDLPAGVRVVSVLSNYRPTSTSSTWSATVTLRWAGHQDDILLVVSPDDPFGATTSQPLPAGVRVDSHEGFVVPGYGRQVAATLGHGAFLLATAVLPTDGSSLSADQLDTVVRSVSVVDRPDQVDTWADAATALP